MCDGKEVSAGEGAQEDSLCSFLAPRQHSKFKELTRAVQTIELEEP